jgi:hypothetical protein
MSPTAKDLLHKVTLDELARYQPLFATGNTSLIHFLTREAADAEKTELWAQVESASRLVSQRDSRIKELEIECEYMNMHYLTSRTKMKHPSGLRQTRTGC